MAQALKLVKDQGFVMTEVVCVECADAGYIETAWEDIGGPESGPKVVCTDGRYCECETAQQLRLAEATMEDYERSFANR